MVRFSLLTLPLLALAACASTSTRVPQAWLSVPEVPHPAALTLAADGTVSQAAPVKPASPIHVEGGRVMNGEKALTEAFAAVDSFDFSPSRGEVVFSAKRKDNFDVGLVSSDGSPIVWIPSADPADEIAVQWAPRGNKVSYIVRARGGDVVRTVHIPTSFNATADFPNGRIHALAWDPQAERYAVAYSTPDASERVEIVKYDGSSRRITSPPAVTLAADLEPFAKDAVLLRPRDIRYDERLPLVVWVEDDFTWSDARAALFGQARLAIVISRRAPDDELWKTAKELPWIDAARTFVVDPRARAATGDTRLTIVPDPSLPPNHYRRTGSLVSVAPAVIQSFAAGFIADHLKRTAPAHGRSR